MAGVLESQLYVMDAVLLLKEATLQAEKEARDAKCEVKYIEKKLHQMKLSNDQLLSLNRELCRRLKKEKVAYEKLVNKYCPNAASTGDTPLVYQPAVEELEADVSATGQASTLEGEQPADLEDTNKSKL